MENWEAKTRQQVPDHMKYIRSQNPNPYISQWQNLASALFLTLQQEEKREGIKTSEIRTNEKMRRKSSKSEKNQTGRKKEYERHKKSGREERDKKKDAA